jgi:hypothetical protein
VAADEAVLNKVLKKPNKSSFTLCFYMREGEEGELRPGGGDGQGQR